MSKLKETVLIYGKEMAGKVIFGFMSLFPLQKKAVFCNFNGKHYDDNPRYISEALHKVNPSVRQVWLKHKGYSFDVPDYVTCVQWPSVRMFYELATARIWVDSHSKPLYVWKRRGQFFLETWHGGLGMKKIEGDAEDVLSKEYITTSRHNVSLADAFASNSSWLSELYRRAFGYQGEILNSGFPKNDVIINSADSGIREKVRSNLGLDCSDRILLYAPTFREKYGTDKWLDIDLERIERSLNADSEEKWKVLVRLHPKMMKETGLISFSDNIIDATMYPDMQELIIATDIFVTDYSSGVFDFILMRKPAFIYASDYELYEQSERGLYFRMDELPFSYAADTDELIRNMEAFDGREYQKKLDDFFEHVGLFENGNASEYLAEYLSDKAEVHGERK